MKTYIAIGAFIAWTLFVGFVGWQVRDGSADTAVATAATAQQAARADQAEGARTNDHATEQTATQAEQQRVDLANTSANDFNTIERRAYEHATANPDPADCDLDGDGLRAWREANAGQVFRTEPDDPGRTTGAVSPDAARSGKR